MPLPRAAPGRLLFIQCCGFNGQKLCLLLPHTNIHSPQGLPDAPQPRGSGQGRHKEPIVRWAPGAAGPRPSRREPSWALQGSCGPEGQAGDRVRCGVRSPQPSASCGPGGRGPEHPNPTHFHSILGFWSHTQRCSGLQALCSGTTACLGDPWGCRGLNRAGAPQLTFEGLKLLRKIFLIAVLLVTEKLLEARKAQAGPGPWAAAPLFRPPLQLVAGQGGHPQGLLWPLTALGRPRLR